MDLDPVFVNIFENVFDENSDPEKIFDSFMDTYLRGSIYDSDNTDITPSSEHYGSENVSTLTDAMLDEIEKSSMDTVYSCNLNVPKPGHQNRLGYTLELNDTDHSNSSSSIGKMNVCTSTRIYEDDFSKKDDGTERDLIKHTTGKYKTDVTKSILAKQENERFRLPAFTPRGPYQYDTKFEGWLENTCFSNNQNQASLCTLNNSKTNNNIETSTEVEQSFNDVRQGRRRQSSVKRSSSNNNILTEMSERDRHQTNNSFHRKCSSADKFHEERLEVEHKSLNLLKRWHCRKTEKQRPSYHFVRRFSLPCLCQSRNGCSCNIVSAIADAGKGYIWIGFMNSRVIKLCSVKGKVKDSVNVDSLVDDLVISKRGDIYISCPSAKCIKVIWSNDPGRATVFEDFTNYQWYPRGLAVSPIDDTLLACLAAKCVEYTTPVTTHSTIMRFDTNKKSCKASLVTNEKCFGYPLRLAISTEEIIIVSDYGFHRITILNEKGLVLVKFNEVDEMTISPRLALCFHKENDEAVIVQGRQPTIIDLKLDGSPFSAENHRISELNESTINTAIFGTDDHLFVGMWSGVINIFEKY